MRPTESTLTDSEQRAMALLEIINAHDMRRDWAIAAILKALREELALALEEAQNVVAAARCIRHWHDTGSNNEGMIVSSEHVRKLWAALERYDKALESRNA